MGSHDEMPQGLASEVAEVGLLTAHVTNSKRCYVGLVVDRVRLVLAVDHQDSIFAS